MKAAVTIPANLSTVGTASESALRDVHTVRLGVPERARVRPAERRLRSTAGVRRAEGVGPVALAGPGDLVP